MDTYGKFANGLTGRIAVFRVFAGPSPVFSAVLAAIKNTGWDPNTIAMVSGIGCTGRMAGYIRNDWFIGSINLAPGSFDTRRELAIAVHDDAVVKRLQHYAHHDWAHSHALDLSDAGLLADLKQIEVEATRELALEGAVNKEKTQ